MKEVAMGDAGSVDWKDIVLYPVPIDRVGEVRALLSRPPAEHADADRAAEEFITHMAASG
jgi:hypothetical protein